MVLHFYDLSVGCLTDTKNGSARTGPLSKSLQVLAAALNYPVRPLDTDLIFWGEPGRDGSRRAYEFRMAWKKIIKETKITNLKTRCELVYFALRELLRHKQQRHHHPQDQRLHHCRYRTRTPLPVAA